MNSQEHFAKDYLPPSAPYQITRTPWFWCLPLLIVIVWGTVYYLNEKQFVAEKKQDKKTTLSLEQVAQQGDAHAQFLMGRNYMRKGDGQNAVYWYELAAKQGHWEALNNLGVYYVEGRDGIEKDVNKACYLFRRSYQEMPEKYTGENIRLCEEERAKIQQKE